jgi:hypothetical protein
VHNSQAGDVYTGAVDLKLCTVLRGNDAKSSAAGVLPRPPADARSTSEPLLPAAENKDEEELALNDALLNSPGVDPRARDGLELPPVDEVPALPFTGRSWKGESTQQVCNTCWSPLHCQGEC